MGNGVACSTQGDQAVFRIIASIAAGLVEGEQMSVDGSFIMAKASHHSRIPREQFTEAAQVNYGARKYLEELEQENGDGEPIHQQDKVSTTDPDSTYLTKEESRCRTGLLR